MRFEFPGANPDLLEGIEGIKAEDPVIKVEQVETWELIKPEMGVEVIKPEDNDDDDLLGSGLSAQ